MLPFNVCVFLSERSVKGDVRLQTLNVSLQMIFCDYYIRSLRMLPASSCVSDAFETRLSHAQLVKTARSYEHFLIIALAVT